MTQSCFLGEAKGHFKLQSNFRQTQNLYWRYYSGFLCCCCYLIAKLCPTLLKPQAPLSMGFPRQQYWSGLPFPSPGDLPDPGIQPVSPAIADVFFTTVSLGKPCQYWWVCSNQTNLIGTFSKMKWSWFFLTSGTSWWHTHWQVPLEKGMATHSSILVWKIPWTEEPGRL